MFQRNLAQKFKISILYSIMFFENNFVFQIMWKNSVQKDRPQMTIWHMHITC